MEERREGEKKNTMSQEAEREKMGASGRRLIDNENQNLETGREETRTVTEV